MRECDPISGSIAGSGVNPGANVRSRFVHWLGKIRCHVQLQQADTKRSPVVHFNIHNA